MNTIKWTDDNIIKYSVNERKGIIFIVNHIRVNFALKCIFTKNSGMHFFRKHTSQAGYNIYIDIYQTH